MRDLGDQVVSKKDMQVQLFQLYAILPRNKSDIYSKMKLTLVPRKELYTIENR